jgi:hypothetical protein
MEHGFYHPERGYWQTNSDVPQTVLDTYPEGTADVPLKPGADYEWSGNEWVAIPPTAPTREEQEAKRQAAYAAEADPLFFKWHAGEGTEQEWLAKREEIRSRFPYPEE